MKITRVTCWKENLELTRPYTIAYRTIDHVENVFVRIDLANGLYGIGSGSPAEFVTGEHIQDSVGALEAHARELLEGQDIRHFRAVLRRAEELMPRQPAARAAIDIALYDAFARLVDVPLVKLLGQVYEGLPTSVTIGIKSIEETVEEGNAYVAEGFRVIKLKTGHEVEADIETFTRLREAVGFGVKIRVDANQGYTAEELEHFAAATSHLDVEFYEQPLPPRRLTELLHLPASLRRLCAADEDLHDPADAIRLAADPQPYGIYNIKLMKCGGVEAARRIAEVAHSAGIHLMWGCNDESIISITAALHTALANPATRYLDLDGSFDLARDIVDGGFILRNGILYPGEGAGLGVWIEE